jgi:hypothetical protein
MLLPYTWLVPMTTNVLFCARCSPSTAAEKDRVKIETTINNIIRFGFNGIPGIICIVLGSPVGFINGWSSFLNEFGRKFK